MCPSLERVLSRVNTAAVRETLLVLHFCDDSNRDSICSEMTSHSQVSHTADEGPNKYCFRVYHYTFVLPHQVGNISVLRI